jgi:hypothetical protein
LKRIDSWCSRSGFYCEIFAHEYGNGATCDSDENLRMVSVASAKRLARDGEKKRKREDKILPLYMQRAVK